MLTSTYEFLAAERGEAVRREALRARRAVRHVIPLSGPVFVYHGPAARLEER